MKKSALLFCFALVGCSPRDFHAVDGASEVRTVTSTGGVEGAPNDLDCLYPKSEEFATSLDGARRDALLKSIETSQQARLKQVAATIGIPLSNAPRWILRAVTPLNMGCRSFGKGDIFKYGEASYSKFSEIVIRAYGAERFNDLPLPEDTDKKCPLVANSDAFPDVKILRIVNKQLSETSAGILRKSGDPEVIQGVPLVKEELALMREREKEGYLNVYKAPRAFFNEYSVYVKKGSWLVMHLKSEQVCGKLQEWQKRISALAEKSEAEYIEGIAKEQRICVMLHPFFDGNGRSCGAWAVAALARRGIPHPLLWAGEDYSLPEKEWAARIAKGVEIHRNLAKELSNP